MDQRTCKSLARLVVVLGGLLLTVVGCGNDDETVAAIPTPTPAATPAAPSMRVTEVDLVSDQSGAANTDANLQNAWGVAQGPTGLIWVSANHSGLSTIYDANGHLAGPGMVTIPKPGASSGGAPTGLIFNDTTDFAGDKFIFDTEDGTIVGWQSSSGTAAVIRADNSGSEAIYKGLTLAKTSAGNFLYATDFHNGKVDRFDAAYALSPTTGTFSDPQLPQGFAPFNVASIGGKLYVTFAKQDDNAKDDVHAPGNGYISIFDTNGVFLSRFASQGTLNSPWALALAPADFNAASGNLLVGNFGDGRINVFNPNSGQFIGQLQRGDGSALSIDGLWALVFGNDIGVAHNVLLFTAGPNDEANGLLGRLTS